MRKLLVTTLLLAACGGGGGNSLTLAEYPDAAREAFCRFLVRCGDIASLDVCMTSNIGLNIHIPASLEAGIDMSKVKFSGTAASACLDALANQSCDLTSQSSRVPIDACAQLVTGTRHNGDACAIDAECVSQVCDVTNCDPSAACCMGTCAGEAAPAPVQIGQSCASAPCVPSGFCEDASSTCMALKTAGTACNATRECDYGLACLGTCQALPTLGQPCTEFCRDEGTTCSATTQTCVKVVLAGGSCTPNALASECSPLYPCDATGHCSAGIAIGQACGFGDLCAGNTAFCDIPIGQNTGTCSLPKPNGSTCARDAACQSAFCDSASLTCVPEPICT